MFEMPMLALALALQAAPAGAPPPACDTQAHAAFDFWIGEWTVTPQGSDAPIAHSKVERLYNGCAIRENWMPFNGQDGGSLNALDPQTGRWHQTWIGSAPGRVEFVGGSAEEGRMVLTGNWPSPAAPHQLIRMTYTLQDDGSVRQFGEASLDHGVTWSTAFDLVYRPRKAAVSGRGASQ
ncbi:hypothetical protein [Paraurantiacibacter namhicola]|uniref:DUF1579 domain-containing protein n=1 Tax=Paraurantiacibacter namhicola TaxID=645517 RepID=A0A1C7D9J8_9SPHN|nr:hypothetical protein [Paraurantiacibacter namhicola]ANU08160.1 hypothetical protein A6F65_01865 [Paraurantiacibacter namhicola]